MSEQHREPSLGVSVINMGMLCLVLFGLFEFVAI
jgi:hypothetical protein